MRFDAPSASSKHAGTRKLDAAVEFDHVFWCAAPCTLCAVFAQLGVRASEKHRQFRARLRL
eukprot:6212789-Pleurochrysis_carterae.AAC.1